MNNTVQESNEKALDEAIEHCNEILASNEYEEHKEHFKQFLNWLKELKQHRQLLRKLGEAGKEKKEQPNDIPFVAFGSDELDKKEELGDSVVCPNCGKLHQVEYGNRILDDGTKVPCKMLAFISCPENEKSYLVGLIGRKL